MRIPPGLVRNLSIVLALLSAGFLAAYVRFLPLLERQGLYTDGRRPVRLSETEHLRFALWDAPERLPAEVNGPEAAGRAALSPDGRLLVFAVGDAGLNAELWVADLVDGEPRAARPLTRVNTPFDELAPAFGPDALYFSSNRPGGRGGLDLWRAAWEDGALGPAEALPEGLNGEHDESDAAPLPGTSRLAFASNRPRGRRSDWDLYVAEPQESGTFAVQPFEVLNGLFEEREPAFTADGRAVLFASDRPGAAGGFDLWRSVTAAGSWLPPEPLAGLCTAGDERAPAPSPDGFSLHFVAPAPSSEAGGVGGDPDLYRSRSVELFRVPGRAAGWMDLVLVVLLLLVALLAWLGRRWEALDVLYKCVLVSLLIHLGLLLWFREVQMERAEHDLGNEARTFRVQLLSSRSRPAHDVERGGVLEDAPRPDAAESAPARQEMEHAPAPPTWAAAAELPLPATEEAEPPAPSTAAASHAERELPATVSEPQAVALQDVAEPAPRWSATPRELSVSPQQTPAEPARRPSAARAPARADEVAAAPLAPHANGTPAPASLPVPIVAARPAEPGSGAAAAPALAARPSSPAASAPVALRGPEAAARPESTASTPSAPAGAGSSIPQLALVARSEAPPAARDGSAPPRRGPAVLAAGARRESEPLHEMPAAPSLPAPDLLAAAPPPSTLPGAVFADRPARSQPAVALRDAPAHEDDPSARAAAGGAPEGPSATSTKGEDSLLELPASRATALAGPASRPAEPGTPSRWSASGPSAASEPPSSPSLPPLALATEPPRAPAPRSADLDDTPYRARFGERKQEALVEHGGSVETERAVAAGLAYLARIQNRQGFWGSADDFDDKYGHVAVGKTALCLLAFLGAGHTPASGSEHSDVVARAVQFLLGVQDEPTGHFGYNEAYSHGTATYALAECYALTKEPRLEAPLERAVAWILRQQSQSADRRRFGGWTYYYPDGRTFDGWPRASITAWQVMALRSAQLAGLSVPERAFADARSFLQGAHRRDQGVILYSQDPERLSSSYWTLPGSTPAGLFALSLLGEDVGAPEYRSAIAWVVERSPTGYARGSTDAFVERAAGNLYFWYCGSLALLRHGGEAWDTWNRHLQTTLLPSQDADGSWEPIDLYAEYAGDDAGDKSYTTALCVLNLEVYYRYFTPLLR